MNCQTRYDQARVFSPMFPLRHFLPLGIIALFLCASIPGTALGEGEAAPPVPETTQCQALLQYSVLEADAEAERVVDVENVSVEGASKEIATGALNTILANRGSKILNVCRETYENSAACMARKLQAFESTLATLSFSAKKELEKGVIEDCRKRSGRCRKVQMTTPNCVAKAVPTAVAGEEGKKDEKAKPKKK